VIVSLVAAVAENGVIGRDGALPWRLPADLRFFKRLTTGHTIIMGRRTWDEIQRPLPDRRNIVISRNPDAEFPGADRAPDLASALALAAGDTEVFVIGGGEIFRAALPMADRMYLTEVHAEVDGDTRFPAWDPTAWRVATEDRYEADERHPHAFTIRQYDRREK
jgi:dihydrofolate reductase